MHSSYYPATPFDTIDDLAIFLDEKPSSILELTYIIEKYYQENPIKKANGKMRMTYRVKSPLKEIQSKIKKRIFTRVVYAKYLFCGIRGRKGSSANGEYHCLHSSPKALLQFDIQNFYPSITPFQIKELWLKFFKFSEPVADLLMKLTTCFDQVPQGAATSSDLANLIFWKNELELVRTLESYGAVYSRYGDDITLSLHNDYSRSLQEKIIAMVITFLKGNGFKPNRKKLKFFSQKSPMIINKTICVNNSSLTINPAKRNKARAKVNHYKKMRDFKPNDASLIMLYNSTMGFLYHCKSVKPPHRTITKLIEIMKKIKPK